MRKQIKPFVHKIWRRTLWPNPTINIAYLKLRGFDVNISDVKLVVQGFPRSGNTYLSNVLKQQKKFDGHIFSHIHTPAIFHHAKVNNVPVIMPIRKPVPSIVSLMQLSGWDSDRSIDHYICYYKYSMKHVDGVIITNFDDFTKDTPSFLKKVQDFTGLAFKSKDHDTIMEAAFNEIDLQARSADGVIDPHTVHRPNAIRTAAKADLEKALLGKYGEELKRCDDLFQFFHSRINLTERV